MSTPEDKKYVLRIIDGLRFLAGESVWELEPVKMTANSWTAFVPQADEITADPSHALAWTLAAMAEPIVGAVELFDQDVYRMTYSERQRLRGKLGFVHSYGGLISNRNLWDNIALPVSVHGRLTASKEAQLVGKILADFSLQQVAGLRPHEMDGATRWRACLARAVVLRPKWLVLEGHGNWEMDRGRGIGWNHLVQRHCRGEGATAICLPRRSPGFESWFLEQGGKIVQYHRLHGILQGKGQH